MDVDTATLVAQIIQGLDPGAFVTKFVLVAEVLDTDGNRAVWTETSDDASKWDAYGLLTFALEEERAGQVATRLRDDD